MCTSKYFNEVFNLNLKVNKATSNVTVGYKNFHIEISRLIKTTSKEYA